MIQVKIIIYIAVTRDILNVNIVFKKKLDT